MGAAEGINPNKIRTIDLIFVMTVTACGALFFLVTIRAMNGQAYSEWLVPFFFAVIYASLLSIFAVSVGIKKLLSPVIFISLLPSIILTPVIAHIITVFSMYFVIMYGLLTMRRTLFNVLTIDIRTIVHSGIFYVSFGLVVILTSQYYFSLKNDVDHVFDSSKYVGVVNVIMDTILQKSNVEHLSIDHMTIDDFLRFMIQDVYVKNDLQEYASGPAQENMGMIVRWAGNMGIAIEDVQSDIEAQAVESMKMNIAEKVGHTIQGEELASQVLSELITVQLRDIVYSSPGLYAHRMLIFSVIFFMVLLPIASIGKFFTVIFARVGFAILRETKLIRITRSQREAEVIAL